MGFDIGSALMGGIEGFMLTGSPIGAGIGAVEGGLTGNADGLGAMLSDSMSAGGDGGSTLAAYSALAEAFG